MKRVEQAFFKNGKTIHDIDPSVLPNAIIPEFLSERDVADFAKRAVAHFQLKERFEGIMEGATAEEAAMPGFGAMIAKQGLETATRALDLLAPVVDPTESSWYGTIRELADLATEQGIDFADEVRL